MGGGGLGKQIQLVQIVQNPIQPLALADALRTLETRGGQLQKPPSQQL
jgi:hypothetical protein